MTGQKVRVLNVTHALLLALVFCGPVAAQDAGKAAEITFDFDDDAISPEARAVLSDAAGRIAAQGQASARVIGHADAPGSAAYNLDLAERRARAAAAVLEASGLPQDRIAIETRGETAPAVPTQLRERANRRVTVLRGACASWRSVVPDAAQEPDFVALAQEAAAMNSALSANGAMVGAYMMSPAAVRSCAAAAGYEAGAPRREEYARRCVCDVDRMQTAAYE